MKHDELPETVQIAHEKVADLIAEAMTILTEVNEGDQELAALNLAVITKNIYQTIKNEK